MVYVSLIRRRRKKLQIKSSSHHARMAFYRFFSSVTPTNWHLYFSKSVGRSISFPFLVVQEYIKRFRSIGYCDIQFVRKPAKKDMSEQNIQDFYACFLWFKISPVLTGVNFFQVRGVFLLRNKWVHTSLALNFFCICVVTPIDCICLMICEFGSKSSFVQFMSGFFWHRMGMDGHSSC